MIYIDLQCPYKLWLLHSFLIFIVLWNCAPQHLVMDYLCNKCPWICSTCRKHFPVLSSFTTYYPVFVTRLTRRVPLVEQELPTLPEHMSSSQVFSGDRVTRSLVLYVCFVDRCLSFYSFGHCVVCSSSIDGFWLPLWYIPTLSVKTGFCHSANVIDMNYFYPCIKFNVFLPRFATLHSLKKNGTSIWYFPFFDSFEISLFLLPELWNDFLDISW